MRRKLFASPILLLFGILFAANGQTSSPRLTAPTFYIAASAEYGGSNWIYLRGASNLPSGAHLLINMSNYVGEGSSILSQDTRATVDRSGFFEATILPKAGAEFRHNLACQILFMPTFPDQERSVFRAVGKDGSKLWLFGRNPQAKVISGGYYLEELIHVP